MGLARWLCVACVCACGRPEPTPAGGDVGVYSDEVHAYSPWASFWDRGPAVERDNYATFGPCKVLIESGGVSNNPRLAAGTVTITGGTKVVTLTPDANGSYVSSEFPFMMGPLWNGGETLTFSATGDPNGVPAFSGSAVAPTPITIVSPALSGSGADVPRDQPLHLSWTGETVGDIYFHLGFLMSDGPSDIDCTFPAAAGGATISEDLLSQLPMSTAWVEIKQANHVTVQAGRFPIDLSLLEFVATGIINFR